MSFLELLGLLALAGLGWYWLDGLKARDAAVAAARQACAAEGLQLLDDTVMLTKTRTGRDDEGQLRLQRSYAFEYSDTGDNRRRGGIVLLGQEVVLVNVGLRTVH